MDIPGCVCGRGGSGQGGGVVGSVSNSLGISSPWLKNDGSSTPSSVSTSLLTKNKPFPIRG